MDKTEFRSLLKEVLADIQNEKPLQSEVLPPEDRPKEQPLQTKSLVPSIFIATPSIGGPKPNHHSFCIGLQAALMTRNISYNFFLMDGCSLIGAARNSIVREFMKSDMTHLLMMDDDISLDVKDFFRMLQLGRQFVCGAVPMRRFNHKYIDDAVSRGVTKDLWRYASQFNIAPLDINADITPDEKGAISIKFAGTACVLVMRSAIEKIIAETNPSMYLEDGQETYDLFDCPVVNKTYTGEDARFCERWRMTGGKVWCLPDIYFTHYGPTDFRGRLTDAFEWT